MYYELILGYEEDEFLFDDVIVEFIIMWFVLVEGINIYVLVCICINVGFGGVIIMVCLI